MALSIGSLKKLSSTHLVTDLELLRSRSTLVLRGIAMDLAVNITRQPYDFDNLLGGIMVLADEYEELKRERKKARLQILQEELERLENE
jgi:hypothetical protein